MAKVSYKYLSTGVPSTKFVPITPCVISSFGFPFAKVKAVVFTFIFVLL